MELHINIMELSLALMEWFEIDHYKLGPKLGATLVESHPMTPGRLLQTVQYMNKFPSLWAKGLVLCVSQA